MAFGVLVADRGAREDSAQRWPGSTEEVLLAQPSQASAVTRWSAAAGLTEVLVLTRPRDRVDAVRLATLLAGARPGLAATVHVVETTTLAMAVTAAAVLEQRLAAPVAHAAIVAGLRTTVSGAVLRRVTRLESPRPSMWQHLASIFGRRHVALLSTGAVLRAGTPLPLPESAVILATAADAAAAGGEAAAIFGVDVEVLTVPQATSIHSTFGSDGFEFVAFSPVVAADVTARCHVCEGRLVGSLCPFCRVRSLPQELVS